MSSIIWEHTPKSGKKWKRAHIHGSKAECGPALGNLQYHWLESEGSTRVRYRCNIGMSSPSYWCMHWTMQHGIKIRWLVMHSIISFKYKFADSSSICIPYTPSQLPSIIAMFPGVQPASTLHQNPGSKSLRMMQCIPSFLSQHGFCMWRRRPSNQQWWLGPVRTGRHRIGGKAVAPCVWILLHLRMWGSPFEGTWSLLRDYWVWKLQVLDRRR